MTFEQAQASSGLAEDEAAALAVMLLGLGYVICEAQPSQAQTAGSGAGSAGPTAMLHPTAWAAPSAWAPPPQHPAFGVMPPYGAPGGTAPHGSVVGPAPQWLPGTPPLWAPGMGPPYGMAPPWPYGVVPPQGSNLSTASFWPGGVQPPGAAPQPPWAGALPPQQWPGMVPQPPRPGAVPPQQWPGMAPHPQWAGAAPPERSPHEPVPEAPRPVVPPIAAIDHVADLHALHSLVMRGDYFRILGLDPRDDHRTEDIQRAHAQQRGRVRVDLFADRPDLLIRAREVEVALDQAYDVLRVPQMRAAYRANLL